MRIGRCRYIQDGRGPGDLDCGITGASVGDDCGAPRGMGPGDDGAGCLPRQVLHYARGERQFLAELSGADRYEGITCDDSGTPRGKYTHHIECDEEGEHLPGTCRLVMNSMTLSVAEAGPDYQALLPCRVCHTAA